MPIKVACKCGQSFAAPDNLAGKNVKCPKCGSPLSIPRPQGAPSAQPNPAKRAAGPAAPQFSGGGLGDLFDEAGMTAHAGPRCPNCNTPASPTTTICVKCGYNAATGQLVQSGVKNVAEVDGHGGGATALMLAKAAEELAKAPAPKADAGGNPWVAWGVTLVCIALAAGVMYGAVAGFLAIEKTGRSYHWAGIVMQVLGAGFVVVSYVAIAVICFKEGTTQGILAMTTIVYGWYLGVIKAQGFWVVLSILGFTFYFIGWATTTYLAPMQEGKTTLLSPELLRLLA